jgi:hypothetical protein
VKDSTSLQIKEEYLKTTRFHFLSIKLLKTERTSASREVSNHMVILRLLVVVPRVTTSKSHSTERNLSY